MGDRQHELGLHRSNVKRRIRKAHIKVAGKGGLMRKCTKNYLENILRMYPRYTEMIKSKEQELLNPSAQRDQSSGGGRSGIVGKPTEKLAISVLTDKEISVIINHKRAIEKVLEGVDDITNGIVVAHYFNQTKIDVIAGDLGTTPDLCNKLRRKYLNELATELSLIK